MQNAILRELPRPAASPTGAPAQHKLPYLTTPRLELSVGRGFLLLDPLKIIRCQADANYTEFYLEDGSKHLASRTLKSFEERLPNDLFFRAHQSHLINVLHITGYTLRAPAQISLSDGTTVPLSRKRKAGLRELLARLCG